MTRSPTRWLRPLAYLLLIGGIAVGGAAFVGSALGLRLNLTNSIPPGIYRSVDGQVSRGTIVLVCLPDSLATFARDRDYIPKGSCANGTAPIGKPVAALAGDSVTVTPQGIRVNDALITASASRSHDSRGRQLLPVRPGAYIVRADEVWLLSTYSAASFDSRYFGPIHRDRIVGHIRPVFTFP